MKKSNVLLSLKFGNYKQNTQLENFVAIFDSFDFIGLKRENHPVQKRRKPAQKRMQKTTKYQLVDNS